MNTPQEIGSITPANKPDPAQETLARLKHLLGLDRAIAWTVAGRLWSVIAGAATVLLIARFLSPAEQGYYYTFSSLVALQIFFELGFAYVVLQMASHERASLHIADDGIILGDPVSQARLASILRTSLRWYAVMAVIMAVTLLPAGLYFFHRGDRLSSVTGWQTPWCILALAASFNLLVDPVFSFLEGCGLVSKVAHMRLGQAMLGTLLAWAALIAHHGLFAPPMILLGEIAVGLAWLFKRRALLLYLLRVDTAGNRVSWLREIWPFQWKIAISWLSGYFIFQMFNPVLFAYQGPVAAGRMGMSLTVMGALSALSMAWINTKASPFGVLVAQKKFEQLDRLFFTTLKQSMALIALACAAVFAALLLCSNYLPRVADRVLTPRAFLLLLLTAIVNQLIFSQAIYLRAHKAEPFLAVGICAALVEGCCTYLLGRFASVNAVATGFFVVTCLLAPWTTYIFQQKRKQWHTST
jgi:hypothetical protein